MLILLLLKIFASNKHGIPEPISNDPIIAEITKLDYETAASKLGLKVGDKINQIDNVNIKTWDDLSSSIRNKPNEIINVKWTSDGMIREGLVKTDTLTTVIDYKLKTIGMLV